jgi:hypothetical protein
MFGGQLIHAMAVEAIVQDIGHQHRIVEGASLAAKDAEIASLKNELAGTIKVRDQAFDEIARLKAQVTRLQDDLANSRRINDVQAKLFALLGELSKSAVRQDGASS